MPPSSSPSSCKGTTLGRAIGWARLAEDARSRPPLDLFAAETALLQAQLKAVEREASAPDGTLLHPRRLDSDRRRATIPAAFTGSEAARGESIGAHFDMVLAAVAAGRTGLVRLHRTHQIDDETLHDLERDLDLDLDL